MAAENTEELTKRAEAGDKAAREKLAVIFANEGNLKAKEELALLYADGGVVIQKDEKKAFELYLELASKGIPEWQCNLAQAYDFGEGTEPNLDEAIRWYQKASAQGYVPARYNLGVINEVEKKKIPKAVRYYFSAANEDARKALARLAKKGHFIAQFYLAMLDQATKKQAVVALLKSNPIEFCKILFTDNMLSEAVRYSWIQETLNKEIVDSLVTSASDPKMTPEKAEASHELGVRLYEWADHRETFFADTTELVSTVRKVSQALFAGLLQNGKGLEDGTTQFYFNCLVQKENVVENIVKHENGKKKEPLYPYSSRAAATIDFFPEALPDVDVTTSTPVPKVSSPASLIFRAF